MEKLVKRIIRKMEYGGRLVTLVIFCSMMMVVTAQIVMRYPSNNPLLWSEGFTRYAYVWLVFIGSTYCVTQDKHVAATLIMDHMPSMVRKRIKIVCNLLAVVALIYILPHVLQYVRGQSGLLSGRMQTPMSRVFTAVPVGYTLIVIHVLLQTILIVKGTPEKEVCG